MNDLKQVISEALIPLPERVINCIKKDDQHRGMKSLVVKLAEAK